MAIGWRSRSAESGSPIVTAQRVADTFGATGTLRLTSHNPHRGRRIMWLLHHDGKPWFVKPYGWHASRFGAEPHPHYARIGAFENRMRQYGVPVPRIIPTMNAPERFYGAIRDPKDKRFLTHSDLVNRYIITAHEYVPDLRLPVDDFNLDAEQFMHRIGTAFALMQNAAIGIGPWSTYPNNGPDYWCHVAREIDELGLGSTLSRELEKRATLIGEAELSLPLTESGSRRLIPDDHEGNNVELDPKGNVVVFDWELLSPDHDWPTNGDSMLHFFGRTWALVMHRISDKPMGDLRQIYEAAYQSALADDVMRTHYNDNVVTGCFAAIAELRRSISSAMFDEPHRKASSREIIQYLDQACRLAEPIVSQRPTTAALAMEKQLSQLRTCD